MSCNKGCDAAFDEMTEDGAAPMPRLPAGRCPRPVHQESPANVNRLSSRSDDIGDVRRKRAERLLDGLFVADVGKDIVEARKF